MNTERIYKATINYTKGWGGVQVHFRTNNYKELVEKVNEWLAKWNGAECKILGQTSNIIVFDVLYNYPSGKSYKQKLY